MLQNGPQNGPILGQTWTQNRLFFRGGVEGGSESLRRVQFEPPRLRNIVKIRCFCMRLCENHGKIRCLRPSPYLKHRNLTKCVASSTDPYKTHAKCFVFIAAHIEPSLGEEMMQRRRSNPIATNLQRHRHAS